MSLQLAAQHLASKGRGPDTELIHMTKGEIAGLQTLAKAHGGSLTVNPKTGLAEAGFLESILPMAIGAGLAAATGGTSLALTPGMIGLGVGGLQALRTGNLMDGLTAGLGAYGGAGLAGGLAGLGTSEAGANLSQANEAAMTKLGPEANARDILMARDPVAVANATTMANAPISTGFNAALSDPSKLVTNMGVGNLALAAGAAAAPEILPSVMPKQAVAQPAQPKAADYGPRYAYSPGVADPFPQVNSAGVEQNYYPEQKYTQLSESDAKALYGYAEGGNVQFPYGEAVMRMAMGGLSDLGGYSDGGRLLKGPGDGVSDSIPAQIGGKQPARLADGEFVVPARIVSELGNGSTDAGARQLYAMMDRVQKARGKTTGKGKMANNTNAAKHLPA